MNHGNRFDRENEKDRMRRHTEEERRAKERKAREILNEAAPDLLVACENLVRGQLQNPTLRAYVEHAVWVAEQAIAKTKEVKL
ncbi:hypothetical protein LCGC14_1072990 [marine sediment metagenome]|uniref:Uncharacterized protein n=1 Tax=marine sediment metagenome TaxID=412755 RepID=A0A0F9MML2_9ZZZZ